MTYLFHYCDFYVLDLAEISLGVKPEVSTLEEIQMNKCAME